MKSITNLENLNNQIILLRLDLNVPILDGKITDTFSSITKPSSEKFKKAIEKLI